jgi:hypothetical protein
MTRDDVNHVADALVGILRTSSIRRQTVGAIRT